MDDLIEWFGETERQIADAEPIVCDAERLRELSRDHKVILSSYVISDAALIKWRYNTIRYESLTWTIKLSVASLIQHM